MEVSRRAIEGKGPEERSDMRRNVEPCTEGEGETEALERRRLVSSKGLRRGGESDMVVEEGETGRKGEKERTMRGGRREGGQY